MVPNSGSFADSMLKEDVIMEISVSICTSIKIMVPAKDERVGEWVYLIYIVRLKIHCLDFQVRNGFQLSC